MKVYISGPISGHKIEERRAEFARVKAILEKAGHEVFNPMENGLPETATTNEHMRADFRALVECDAIYMMRRWNHSAGCVKEFLMATACGMDVTFEANGQNVTIKFE
ncbi:MAG: DUF4406 domain-containing protein [Bacteroidaceae bacterium]|nr:DUF4406 domain-containing protein [Bacteroidaceae bacterium]